MNISIVIPAFNEVNSVLNTFTETYNYLKNNPAIENYEIILIDDGSTDNTANVIKNIASAYQNARPIFLKENSGVGAALNAGFKNARFENVYWLPADNQVAIIELDKLFVYIDEYDIVIGKRSRRADNFFRKLFSNIYSGIINIFFKLDVKDINATKLIKNEVIRKIECSADSGFFDAEFLIRAKAEGFKMIEIEVNHQPRAFDSQKGASLKTITNILFDLINNLYNLKKELNTVKQ